jgi:hypothetical protein
MSVVGVPREAVGAQCMATPPMTNMGRAAVGNKAVTAATAMPTTPTASTVKRSKPTAPAVTTAPAPTAMSASATTMPGDCRGVRDDAKRANRNAGRKNANCFLVLHDALPGWV